MKNRALFLFLSLLAGSCVCAGGPPDHPGNTPLGNVAGSTGMVFPKGKARLVIKRMSLSKNNAYDGDKKVADPRNRKMDIDVTHLMWRYGLGHDFDIRVALNIVEKKSAATIPAGPLAGRSFTLKNHGLGDSMVVIRYGLMNQMKGDPLFLSIGAGIKIPTGYTGKSFQTPAGTQTPANSQPMQLGTGSWDGIFEAGATRLLPNSRIDAHAIYLLRGKGNYGYEYGDLLKWNLGYSYGVTQSVGLHLELDGIHAAKNIQNGRSVANTGGDFLYLTPGISWRMGKHMDLSVGYSKMIHRNNNYDALTRMGGLSEDHRLYVRLGVNF